jgi:hypothetical protein
MRSVSESRGAYAAHGNCRNGLAVPSSTGMHSGFFVCRVSSGSLRSPVVGESSGHRSRDHSRIHSRHRFRPADSRPRCACVARARAVVQGLSQMQGHGRCNRTGAPFVWFSFRRFSRWDPRPRAMERSAHNTFESSVACGSRTGVCVAITPFAVAVRERADRSIQMSSMSRARFDPTVPPMIAVTAAMIPFVAWNPSQAPSSAPTPAGSVAHDDVRDPKVAAAFGDGRSAEP